MLEALPRFTVEINDAGITAMLAAAAAGALATILCVINLSDNLKPWM
jgi:precorrin-3B methylase